MNNYLRTSLIMSAGLLLCGIPVSAAPPEFISKSLIFHAPFDGSVDAVKGADKSLYTAETLERKVLKKGNHRASVSLLKDVGRHGGALRFGDNSDGVLLFQGINAGYRESDWSGTVSFWLKLDPDKDLKPGYCDPIQMTDKTWNDAAFFVDFDKDLPRVFRLGVFSDYRNWNPSDTPWEQITVTDRPMVPVSMPPFQSTEWTHVAWTFRDISSSTGKPATATLYLNGKSQGHLSRPMDFHWDVEKSAIMIGISYIGDFDDLAIFDRSLSAEEIMQLFDLPNGIEILK